MIKLLDVIYLTKVRIFKQITTMLTEQRRRNVMLFTLQRYEFLSKSQQAGRIKAYTWRCYLPYKGTNF